MLLDLPDGASDEEVSAAYRQKMMRHDPDHGGDDAVARALAGAGHAYYLRRSGATDRWRRFPGPSRQCPRSGDCYVWRRELPNTADIIDTNTHATCHSRAIGREDVESNGGSILRHRGDFVA